LSTDNPSTEQRILRAAEKVFQESGFAGARMQAIADEAGINKAMLHYYFKSKDTLFRMVLADALNELMPRQMQIMASDRTVIEKIEALVHLLIPLLMARPHLPSFIMYELSQNRGQSLIALKAPIAEREIVGRYFQQIRDEVAAGTILPFEPVDLHLNVMSMCLFPFMSRVFVETMLPAAEGSFDAIMTRRIGTIVRFVRNAVLPG
jgi:AcrR family transcriptional regulator